MLFAGTSDAAAAGAATRSAGVGGRMKRLGSHRPAKKRENGSLARLLLLGGEDVAGTSDCCSLQAQKHGRRLVKESAGVDGT